MANPIRLNVGGTTYITTKETLTGSYFEAMFSDKLKPGTLINDAYFIDRNGQIFSYILDYLRDLDTWLPPSNPDLLRSIVQEARFYCLDE